MNIDKGHIVAVRRNPIYDNDFFRNQCNRDVVNLFHKYVDYDYNGIGEFVLPWMKDKPKEFYCSELVNYLSLKHGKVNLRGDNSDNDDLTPYQIQTSPLLQDVPKLIDFYKIREMDYILTTSKSAIAAGIKIFEKDIKHAGDQNIASHAGIVVLMDGRFWIAEMLGDGSEISSINKYKVV